MKFKLFFLFLSLNVVSQIPNDSLTKKLFKEVVYYLADDSLHGRMPGTIDETKSLVFIEKKMNSLGKNKFQRQAFSFQKEGFSEINATNGFVFVNNKAKNTILISAHYDHIGYGSGLSTQFEEYKIHNGADDNASGVAFIMGLYSHLIKSNSKQNNYLFVFYSGHELGLYGSDRFSKWMTKNPRKFKNIAAVFNFDMIGRMDNELKIIKCSSNEKAKSILEKVNVADFDLKMNVGEENQLTLLDTKPFYLKEIACLNFTTGIHLDYHKPTDDAQYINFEGMVKIEKYLLKLIQSCDTN